MDMGGLFILWSRKGSNVVILNHRESQGLIFSRGWRLTRCACSASLVAFALIAIITAITQPALGQTFSVIHDFTGGQDGASPFTGLTIDANDNIYGTAFGGGTVGYGTIFLLDNDGGGWVLSPLYSFADGDDGAGPFGRLIFGPDGALYGSTSAGGGGPCLTSNDYHGCGTVYSIRPPTQAPTSVLSEWSSTILYRFSGSDGSYPQGELAFDQAGNIYGTTVDGGPAGWGLIFSLTPSNGGWTQNILYQPRGDGDGEYPWSGVVFDQAGNLYGVFGDNGPYGHGAAYKLTPSGSGWIESTIHGFTYHGDDGGYPQGGFTLDASGNLYSTTVHSATAGGTVFEMVASDGSWSYDFIYGLSGGIGLGPYDKLLMDASGNLYGTTFGDGRYGFGSVFKLTRVEGGWSYTSLHDFTGGKDGSSPVCKLAFDSTGTLYGTASSGGAYGMGVVFQIVP
jgi:uncharacterized repeat protein (TIGR03803 family)